MQPTGLIKLNGNKEKIMPQGKGTYGKTIGRPPKKKKPMGKATKKVGTAKSMGYKKK